MKWRDHKRISYIVCKEFLGEDVARKVAEASILPDKEPDYVWVRGKKRTYRKRVAHHSREGVKIGLKYLKIARRRYVRGGNFEDPLGRALHYFQDYTVSDKEGWFIFSWRSHEKHDERESLIAQITLKGEPVKRGFNEVVYPSQFENVVYSRGQRKDPHEVVDNALYLSALAVKLVVNPSVPERIEEKYSQRLRIHVFVVLVAFLVVFVLAEMWGVDLLGSSIFGFLSGYVTHKLDVPFHCLRFDYKWWKGEV